MQVFTVSLFVLLLIGGLLQMPFSYRLSRVIRRERKLKKSGRMPKSWPKAGVVLAIRGADHSLKKCLQAVMQQDYPNHTVHIVIDSELDPAWRLAEAIAAANPSAHVHIQRLRNVRSNCSLKCSALIQAFDSLEDDCEILAFLDADVVPHSTWLQELVAPLVTDSTVGATTGNRWFMPEKPGWAAMTRAVWSAGALVQMCTMGVPWGGSLATRVALIRSSDLLEQWSRSFNDDLVVGNLATKSGLKVRFVPELIMLNQESCTWQTLVPWLTRQLVHVRFYHRGWPALFWLGILSSAFIPVGILAAVFAVAEGETVAASWALAGVAVYLTIMLNLYWQVQRLVGDALRDRPVSHQWQFGVVRLISAIILCHVVYGRALLAAAVLHTVHWRGITYRIFGPWDVQILRSPLPKATILLPAVPASAAARSEEVNLGAF